MGGIPPLDRAAQGVLATWRAVCFMGSRRGTFLLLSILLKCIDQREEVGSVDGRDKSSGGDVKTASQVD